MAVPSTAFSEIHKRVLFKPDGRELVLYGRQPLDTHDAPQAGAAGARASHLRWHPLRGEWVVYAGHRQNRTFLPPPEWNPLAPSTGEFPTEVPAGNWEVAVFENLFSALGSPPDMPVPPQPVATGACGGRTEVVVFTQDPKGSLGALSVEQIDLVLAVWADRTSVLGALDRVAYVFPFENRGVEVGVTLQHPHGQIYAYPFVPPAIERELSLMRAHHGDHGRGLLEDLIAAEVAADLRTLYCGDYCVAWVPVFARWAYEVWVAPRSAAPMLSLLAAAERRDLARALQIALRKLDGLWQRPMPYVLSVHQAPPSGYYAYAHVHIQIYPWLRMRDRMKFLAGSEIGAGVFTADTLPEDKAAELRAVEVP